MMGLNLPPSEERSCRNPALPQASQDRVQVAGPAQAPVERQSRRDTHAAAGDAGPVFQQDYRTQVGLCSTDTGTQTTLLASELAASQAKLYSHNEF